jgi:hypothetical protein
VPPLLSGEMEGVGEGGREEEGGVRFGAERSGEGGHEGREEGVVSSSPKRVRCCAARERKERETGVFSVFCFRLYHGDGIGLVWTGWS